MEPGKNPKHQAVTVLSFGAEGNSKKPAPGAGGRFPLGTTLIPAEAPEEGRPQAGTGAAPDRPRGPPGSGAAPRRERWEDPRAAVLPGAGAR